MKSRSIITYTTVRGSYSLSLSRLTVLLVLSGALALPLMVAVSFSLLSFMHEQRNLALASYQGTTERYSDVLHTNRLLLEDVGNLQAELQQKNHMLRNADIMAYFLKQDTVNDIFSEVQPVSLQSRPLPTDNDLGAMISGLNNRLTALYQLPSGSPLLEESYISSGFGVRRHPVTSVYQFHHGIDMPLRVGDEIISTADGTVSFAGRKAGYGNTVIVQHQFGFSTTYAHLDQTLVERGDIVRKGQIIGAGGNTGISTGPHLHYEVNYLGASLNPYYFYTWNLDNFDSMFSRFNRVKWQQIVQSLQGQEQNLVQELVSPLSQKVLN